MSALAAIVAIIGLVVLLLGHVLFGLVLIGTACVIAIIVAAGNRTL
jgi:hypothetical protein